jgi:hypothetical protein
VRIVRGLAALVALTIFAPAGSTVDVPTNAPGEGPERVVVRKDDPTTAGSFDGTWMYVNRDARFALWIRTKDGVRRVKVQYQSLASPEAFETDWDGKALYYLSGTPVTFELKVGKTTPDQILGTWSWILTIDRSGRRESADLVIYRTLYGRTLLMDFQNFQKTITRDGKSGVMKTPMIWAWNKVSKRELLWDELPF